ncbi:NUDIX hydrolase [Sutcliffiella cohnii]|uniref:NUDIX hydrolase n=1 Tax=Sutcliffiella cohnii TaxID=33932 RepID=UPI002E218B23|nr:8-oxo-dGTP diphosphatase [Sutcliffiella cohnii]
MILRYTICFIEKNGQLLLLYRNKAPNQFKWNGVGGKIEKDETPYESIKREIVEETGLEVKNVSFRGIVTWNNESGMYVFVGNGVHGDLIEGPEGKLAWKSINWLNESEEAVSNIKYFINDILHGDKVIEHSFQYTSEGEIILYEQKPLTTDFTQSVYKQKLVKS